MALEEQSRFFQQESALSRTLQENQQSHFLNTTSRGTYMRLSSLANDLQNSKRYQRDHMTDEAEKNIPNKETRH
jgi:hypothetical protein